MSSGNFPPPDTPNGSGGDGWRNRTEERRETRIAAKVIRANGASISVTIVDISDNGVRLEGADGLAIGENVLLVFSNSSVVEITIRWALDGHAGARIVE